MRIETPRSGRIKGLAVAVTAAALTAAGLAMAAAPAYAAPVAHGGKPPVPDGRKSQVKVNPYSPANGHAYRHGVVATKAVTALMRANAQVLTSANNLSYGGAVDGIGVTTGHESVYLVFWGSQWGTAGTDANGNTTFSNDTAGAAPRLQQLFKGLGTNGEQWSGVMTQYCEGVAAGSQTCPSTAPHVAYPAGGALAGVWADTGVASPAAATAAQLGQTAVTAASHFGNTTAAANRNAQYVILSAHGTNPDNYQTGGFCAWHDWNGDVGASSPVGDIAFTNMPYVTDVGASCGQNFVNAGTAGTLDGVTMVEGHEYAETITDQNPAGGWTDASGEENADKCAWLTGTGGAQNVAFGTGSFPMQGTWGNDTAGCQISHAIVGSSTAPAVANPGNRAGTVGTATSLQMSVSGGTAPYTVSASGLPAGLSINASTGLISGTPTTAGTYSVTVTAKDAAGLTGSTSFTWSISAVGTSTCAGPGQKVANSGFESGSASWASTPAVIGQNGPSEPAHAGTWNAWLDGYGTTHTDTVSQTVTIPAGCTATLSFYLHIDTSETTTTTAFDKLTVQAGATTLATYSNLNKAAGYVQRTFNVSSLAGQTVTLKFTGTEDVSLQTSFVLDDITITAS